MTFKDNVINYPLEILNIRKFLGKANTINKYDKLFYSAVMLYLNTDENNKYRNDLLYLINEIELRKKMAINEIIRR